MKSYITYHKFQKSYVLLDFHCGNIFVIVNRRTHIEQDKIALSEGEKYSKTIGVEDAWQRVSVY